MPSIRGDAFLALDAALSPDVNEYERMPSSDPAKFPARHLHDSGQSVIEREAQNSRYDMEITVEGFVQGNGGADTHDKLNDLYADTVTRVMALVGLHNIEAIEEGTLRPSVAPLASVRCMGFALDFAITFATRRGDPTQI